MNRVTEIMGLLSDTPLTTTNLKDRQVLYHQGDERKAVCLIESGYLKLAQVDSNGSEMISALLNGGQIFGLEAGKGNRCRHTVSAKGKARVHCYPVAAFNRGLGGDGRLAQLIIDMLNVREAITERRLRALLTLDVRGRIAVTLSDLATHYGEPCKHGHVVDVPLTQQEFGELIGASRPVVSSELSALRKSGLISYARGFVCVNDMRALDSMAHDLIPGM